MREIKFKAWDKIRKIWIQDFTLDFNKKELTVWKNDEPNFVYNLYEIELIQFTGRKDKNGKEIFDGDILSDGKLQSVVVWKNDGWGIDNGKHQLDDYLGGNEEVIGNILLKNN